VAITKTVKDDKTYLTFTGKVQWATLPPREARPLYKDKSGQTQYSVNVEVTEAELKHLKKQGLDERTKLRDSAEQGDKTKFIELKQAKTKLVKGQLKEFKDPIIVDQYGEKFTQSIGNGSKMAITVMVNEYDKGKISLRMIYAQVLEHIPYDGDAPKPDDFFVFKPKQGGTAVALETAEEDDEDDSPF
jgi:hypothetical protein